MSKESEKRTVQLPSQRERLIRTGALGRVDLDTFISHLGPIPQSQLSGPENQELNRFVPIYLKRQDRFVATLQPEEKEGFNFYLGRLEETNQYKEEVLTADIKGGSEIDHNLEALRLGSSLYKYSLLQKIGTLAKQPQSQDAYRDWLPWAAYYYVPEIMMYIGDVRLVEIFFPDQQSTPSHARQLKFYVEALTSDPKEIAVYNRNWEPAIEFPLTTETYCGDLNSFCLCLLAEEAYVRGVAQKAKSKRQAVRKEVAEWTVSYLDYVLQFAGENSQILTNSQAVEFESFKTQLGEYLDSQEKGLAALAWSGLNTAAGTVRTYRYAKQMGESSDAASDFYRLLSGHIENYTQDRQDLFAVLTNEELKDIYDGSKDNNDGLLDSGIDKQIQRSRVFNRGRSYILTPEETQGVNWAGFTVPDSVTLRFYNKQYAEVVMGYENAETGESTTFAVKVDVRSGALEWSYLESPQEVHTRSLQVSCWRILGSIFSTVDQQRVVEKPKVREDLVGGKKRQRNEDPIYALRKSLVESRPSAQLPFRQEVTKETRLKPISLPDQIDLSGMLGGLGKSDQERIMEAISAFNNRSVYFLPNFKPLSGFKSRYRLRVGDTRIILEEGDDSYQIINAGHRRDIYRRIKRK